MVGPVSETGKIGKGGKLLVKTMSLMTRGHPSRGVWICCSGRRPSGEIDVRILAILTVVSKPWVHAQRD